MTVDFGGWLARWEAQQGAYGAGRERRFGVLLDVLEAMVGTDAPAVVDLGCGPGSLSVRLLDRLPRARVAAVDVDPVLLALGRGGHGARPGLTFVEADLRGPGWAAGLPAGPFDAAVSTTALHWLGPPEIARLYRDLAGLLRPGGVFLDGDHRRFSPGHPRLAAAARAIAERARTRQAGGASPADSWEEWWEAVGAEPGLADAMAARERLGHGHPHGLDELSDEDQCRLLREAGFAEAGTVWQHGDDRILAAVR